MRIRQLVTGVSALALGTLCFGGPAFSIPTYDEVVQTPTLRLSSRSPRTVMTGMAAGAAAAMNASLVNPAAATPVTAARAATAATVAKAVTPTAA